MLALGLVKAGICGILSQNGADFFPKMRFSLNFRLPVFSSAEAIATGLDTRLRGYDSFI